jgi:xylulokinase
VLLPYLDGERTPNLPAVLRGLRSDVTRAAFARAAVEGVLCGLLEGGDILASHGVRNDARLILTGGAARSRSYRQVLADLTGRTVWTCPLAETAAAGAAVQAAAALMNASTDEVAAAWAPALEVGAEPSSAAATRRAYRQAAAQAARPESGVGDLRLGPAASARRICPSPAEIGTGNG